MGAVYQLERIKYQMDILKQQGLIVYAGGYKRRKKYKRLKEIYHFNDWHITPSELRPYAYSIMKFVNGFKGIRDCTVCEIGCGLGDIIRNIHASKKVGIDLSEEAVRCAQMLSREVKDDTEYYVGTLENSAEYLPDEIDVLITVNFIHMLDSEELRKQYEKLMSGIHVKRMIVDVRDVEGGNTHDFTEILSDFGKRTVIYTHKGTMVYLLEKR